MEYKYHNSKIAIITKISDQELLALLKTQVIINIQFFDESDMIDGEKGTKHAPAWSQKIESAQMDLWVFDRHIVNGQQIAYTRIITTNTHVSKTIEQSSYDSIIKFINDRLTEGKQMQIAIARKNFEPILPLLKNLDKFSKEQINGAVFFTYTDGLYHFKFNSKNKLPEEIYWWNTTRDLFYFSAESGPQLFYETEIKTIADLCNALG